MRKASKCKIVCLNKFYFEKTVSLIHGKRTNFFKLKKVLLIQKKFL